MPNIARNRSERLVVCSMVLAALAGCDRREGLGVEQGTVTLVNRVQATMRSAICANCGGRLESALAQRLDPATIIVAPARDRVEVAFERSATPFSSASFRRVIAEVGGEVLSVQIEACGSIETTEQGAWMMSGSSKLLLEGAGPWTPAAEVCVTGDLRDDSNPARLIIRDSRS